MTIRSLEIFLLVTQTMNMQAAARKLYISAPSVSEVISELERECGVRLFERLNRKLYLTREGERMRDYALRLSNVYDEMKRNMGGESEPIKLGATMTVASSVLLPVVKAFGDPKPRVMVCNTLEVERLLVQNRLDIGLVEGVIHDANLRATPVFTDELCLACADHHPFAKQSAVTLADLQGAPLLLRERGSGTRERLELALETQRVKPEVLWECGSIDALIGAVRQNIGVTVISRRLIPPDLKAVPISDFDGQRAFSLVMHRDKYETDAIRRMITICQELAKQEKDCRKETPAAAPDNQ